MHRAVLWLAFFLSGVAGLSYELTWLRYLTQLFGASTPAVAATVAIFFVGLALGSAAGARFFALQRHPLRAYGFLEWSIGGVALIVPPMFGLAASWLITALPAGGESLWMLLGAAGLLLIIPTMLLGATFPAMAAVVQDRGNITHDTGLFYGFNTLGAVCGCLLVSFWALPALGQQHTTWLMAMINAAVGSLCFLWSRKSQDTGEEAPSDDATSAALAHDAVGNDGNEGNDGEEPQRGAMSLTPSLAYGIALVSGFCAIGIEVLWSRALSLSVAGSAYVFALILAAYLTGIGFGSLWISAMHRRSRPRRAGLSLLYLGACLGTLLTIHFFPKLFPATVQMLKHGKLASYEQYLSWIGGFAVLMMLPATIAIGAALPLLIGLATSGSAHAAKLSGRLYGANTLGGVAGSLCATFVLMPTFGLTPAIAALAGLYMLLAFVAMAGHLRRSSKAYLFAGFVGLLACFYVLGQLDDINPLKRRINEKILYYKDLPSGTIGVYQTRRGVRVLRVNNYYGLSRTNIKTVNMQYRLGFLPLLLHPAPRRVLLIGFATGTTLAAIASHPKVTKATCVELHQQIPRLAPLFANANHRVWRHPKVSIQQADGRRFLLRHKGSFDVIVGDLYLPRNPGVGALYSTAHFAAARARLAPGGHFVAWLPGFQLGPKESASIIKAFLAVFPQAEGWIPHWNPRLPIIGLVGRKPATAGPSPKVRRLKASPQILKTAVHTLMYRGTWAAQATLQKLLTSGYPTKEPSARDSSPRQVTRRSPTATTRPTSRPSGARQAASRPTSQPATAATSRPTAQMPQPRPKPREATSASSARGFRLLSTSALRRWALGAQPNRLQHPLVEYAAPRSIMEARIKRIPLSAQTILRIGELRSLQGTPWETIHRKLKQRFGTPQTTKSHK